MPNKIFTSYAKPNLDTVRSLVAYLRSAGLDVWFDKDDLLAGQDWNQVIMEEIKSAQVFLLCLSAESRDRRGYFYKEMRTALDVASTVPPSQLYFMPVRLNMCEIPGEISRYHVLDLFEEGGRELLLRSISAALHEKLTPDPEAAEALTKALGQQTSAANTLNLPAGLSARARSLLEEIIRDDRSEDKGLSLMFISPTQGSHVPYLWDNSVHGALEVPMLPISRLKMAIDELVGAGILKQLHTGKSLSQWALHPKYYPPE